MWLSRTLVERLANGLAVMVLQRSPTRPSLPRSGAINTLAIAATPQGNNPLRCPKNRDVDFRPR